MVALGESGDIGECRVHEVAAAIVGLPGGVVSDVVGASAFLGGSWKVYSISVYPHALSQRVPTYPPYSTNPEAMRKLFATGRPPVPRRIGSVRAEEVLQQRFCIFACDWWYLRAYSGDSSAGQHILDW
jgi:hypothetical protein